MPVKLITDDVFKDYQVTQVAKDESQDIRMNTHVATDASRWQASYDAEKQGILRDAYDRGLKQSIGMIVNRTGAYTVQITAPQGGIAEVAAVTTALSYTTFSVNGEVLWSTDGMAVGPTTTRYFDIKASPDPQTIQITGPVSVTFTVWAWEIDEAHPLRIRLQAIEDRLASLESQILDMKAAVAGKTLTEWTPGTVPAGSLTIPAGWTLGGRIQGKGLNLLLGSTGSVTVNGESAYNNVGLLSLLDPVPTFQKEVFPGDVIAWEGMGELQYAPYTTVVAPTSASAPFPATITLVQREAMDDERWVTAREVEDIVTEALENHKDDSHFDED